MSEDIQNKRIGKLGFGFMRLPKTGNEFDTQQINMMVDAFLQNGGTYFDTAYVYEGSEEALREALVKRHPREKYQIATKLQLFTVQKPEHMRERFETSRSRLGVDYIDCYLLHGLNAKASERAEELGTWKFVAELKEQGLIKHMGFSFHGKPEELDEILSKHPEAEFVQIQINYLDWENPKIQSRRMYEIVRKYGKPIIIMEPVKGGMLTGDSSPIAGLLKEANPDVSMASWALRFAAGLDGVLVTLSGMSSIEQMRDNIKTMTDFEKLSEDELSVISKAVAVIEGIPGIPCTNCEYCLKNCPQKIMIPRLMATYSNYMIYKTTDNVEHEYRIWTKNGGKAADCVACRACEDICPQNIPITDTLEKLSVLFDK